MQILGFPSLMIRIVAGAWEHVLMCSWLILILLVWDHVLRNSVLIFLAPVVREVFLQCSWNRASPRQEATWFSPLLVGQSLNCVRLFVIPWTAARQASLSSIISCSFLKLMSIESVMPCNHLILCCPLLFLPSIFPSIRVFYNESALCIRWPKYWSFSISPSNE